MKFRSETEPLPKVPMSLLVDRIDHVVTVAGIDHAGLGSDFDGVDALPDGSRAWTPCRRSRSSSSGGATQKRTSSRSLGENFLRVLDRAERHAKSKRRAHLRRRQHAPHQSLGRRTTNIDATHFVAASSSVWIDGSNGLRPKIRYVSLVSLSLR